MSIVGRRKLDHPALGTAGGTALYASIENIYTVISNDEAGRYFTYSALANSATLTFDHNFGVPLSELKVMLYSGTFPSLTPILDPVAAGWTIVATSGLTTTKIDLTAPSTGGPFAGVIFIVHDRSISQVTGLVDGQLMIYDSTSGKFINQHPRWASEAAAVTTGILTPTTTRPTQRITTSSASLFNIAGPTTDQVRLLINETASDILISNNTSGTAAQRIITGTGQDFTLKVNAAVIAMYDAALSRWLLIGGGGSGTAPSTVQTANFAVVLGQPMLADPAAGTITATLPQIPAAGGNFLILDANGAASSTKKITVATTNTPVANTLDGLTSGDTLSIDYGYGWIAGYAAPGATSWKLMTQSTTTIQGGQVPGATVPANILAGSIGEVVSVAGGSGGTVAIGASTSGTNLASIALTGGRWEITPTMYLVAGATTAWTFINCGVSTVSGTFDSVAQGGFFQTFNLQAICPVNQAFVFQVGTRVLDIPPGGQTVYFVSGVTYTTLGGATYNAASRLVAKRVG